MLTLLLQNDENKEVMPNTGRLEYSLDGHPARAMSADIALLLDNNDEVFVTEWDDNI